MPKKGKKTTKRKMFPGMMGIVPRSVAGKALANARKRAKRKK